jgi:hypothetical protein
MKLELKGFFKSTLILNYIKIHPVGAMRTDGRTDMTKLTIPFRNFANAPHKWCYGEHLCKGSVQTVNTTVQLVLTRNVTVRLDVSVAVVVAACCWHRSLLLLLLLLVVVMHGDNHQSTVLRSIRTHVRTFHLQDPSEHRCTHTVYPLRVNLYKTPIEITTTDITSIF